MKTVIATSDEVSTLLGVAQVFNDPPLEVQDALTALDERLDPEGLHIMAFAHDSEGVTHSLWLIKLVNSISPRFIWLRLPSEVLRSHTKTLHCLADGASA